MSANPTLQTDSGTAELNRGLDVIIETLKLDPDKVVTPAEQVVLMQGCFTSGEIASMLVLATMRLAAIA